MSKNPKLAYEANEPAFLQKLRGQYGDQSGRLERPSNRPRKSKDDKDDDDAPVYVDETSNEVISKEEYQALVQEVAPGGKEDDASKDPSAAPGDSKAQHKPESTAKQSNLTEVGGQRKRKQVKVVGEGERPEKPETQETQETPETQPKASAPRKPKKAKKIKLSFDEE